MWLVLVELVRVFHLLLLLFRLISRVLLFCVNLSISSCFEFVLLSIERGCSRMQQREVQVFNRFFCLVWVDSAHCVESMRDSPFTVISLARFEMIFVFICLFVCHCFFFFEGCVGSLLWKSISAQFRRPPPSCGAVDFRKVLCFVFWCLLYVI